MARYKGRNVQVESIVPKMEDRFVIFSEEYGTKTVGKSELIFTEDEKSRFVKEDSEDHKLNYDASFKTRASEDKRIADEKALAKQRQDEIDARNYAEMSVEEKFAFDKAKAEQKALEEQAAKPLSEQNPLTHIKQA